MSSKTRAYMAALFLCCGTSDARGLEVCGLIQDAIWRKIDSPIRVSCDLNVAQLRVDPGTKVVFGGKYGITVNGIMQAEGTEAEPISFESAEGNSEGWGTISFEDAIPGSSFSWVVFEGATGSALHVVRTEVPFSHCTFRNNSGNNGGAIRAELGAQDLVVRNCLFQNNHAEVSGGAIYVSGATGEEASALEVEDSLFLENNAGRWDSNANTGGGAVFVRGNARISRSTFRANEARAYTIYARYGVYSEGGALYTDSGSTEVIGSTFIGNRVNMSCHGQTPDPSYPYGGAIFQASGSLSLTNDLIAESWLNGCRSWHPLGSGLFLNTGTCSIVNSTFARNTVRPAIYNSGGTLDIHNAILFWNNDSGDQITGTATVAYSDVQRGFDGDQNINYDPIFDSHYRIVVPSAAIDVGDPDPQYNDGNLPPGLGTLRSDAGFTGGPNNGDMPQHICFVDADGDGYGDPEGFVFMTECQLGTVENDDDCGDSNSSIHPGAAEDPESSNCADGLDDDCDGAIDGEDVGCFISPTPTETPTATATPLPPSPTDTPVPPTPTTAPIATESATVSPTTSTSDPCPGDLDRNRRITVDELVTMVGLSLRGCP